MEASEQVFVVSSAVKRLTGVAVDLAAEYAVQGPDAVAESSKLAARNHEAAAMFYRLSNLHRDGNRVNPECPSGLWLSGQQRGQLQTFTAPSLKQGLQAQVGFWRKKELGVLAQAHDSLRGPIH